ncbi:MAG: hypothetical protein M0R38_12205 [Bacteroidia bacterium]|nr:hypothetical protein [Bacteroidia bacterium]
MTTEELKELRGNAYQFKMVMEDRELPATYEDRILELIDEEIARQSVTDEDVKRAIDILHDWDVENIHDPSVGIWRDEDMANAIPIAITALQQMRAEPCIYCKELSNEKGFLSVKYETCETWLKPITASFCPNCGRKLR